MDTAAHVAVEQPVVPMSEIAGLGDAWRRQPAGIVKAMPASARRSAKVRAAMRRAAEQAALVLSGFSPERIRQVNVWNTLVPAHAVKVERMAKAGVRWLHPTKGWRSVSAARFAAAGITL